MKKPAKKNQPVIILGGGISGLATAWFLKKRGISFLLIEKEPQTGGKVQTEQVAGTVFEYGPNSLRDKSGELLKMVEELGLLNEIISISEHFKTRFLARDGKLHRLSPGLLSVIKTKLISRKGKLRALKEPFIPANSYKDESAGSFLERRFGKEIVDYAADPILSGIYAGDIYELSKMEVMPQLAEYESTFGSIIKGIMKSRKNKSRDFKPSTFTFKKGLQQLTDALTAELSDSIAFEEVMHIQKTGDDFQITTNKQDRKCKDVISCLPAYALAEVLKDDFSDLSRMLQKVEYAPIVTTQVVFDKKDTRIDESGFGFLVSRKENIRLLGAIWKSSIFPELVSHDKIHFTLLSGGATDKKMIRQSIQEVEDQILQEFLNLMNISSEPQLVQSRLWKNAIPQFNVGYQLIRNEIEKFEAENPGFRIGSNFVWGVSVPECVEGAKNLVADFA